MPPTSNKVMEAFSCYHPRSLMKASSNLELKEKPKPLTSAPTEEDTRKFMHFQIEDHFS